MSIKKTSAKSENRGMKIQLIIGVKSENRNMLKMLKGANHYEQI